MDNPLSSNPIKQFKLWLEEATQNEINDPTAMALATATRDGIPSVRMVLLKQIDENGFKFHTNSESQKGTELFENPYASLCFYWKSLRKQVRVQGVIETVSDNEADTYFADRPYKRQIGAWASQQSRPLEDRKTLEDKITKLEQEYPEGTTVPRPAYWKGYRVKPLRIEFWMDNPSRLHDRFTYDKDDQNQWQVTRLYP